LLSSTDIEKKAKAFQTIEDIVSAMKAYAGITIRKTEELVLNIREYEENLFCAIADLMTYYPDISLEERQGKRILIAFGSSQGLCGPFNEKVADAVSENISNNDTLFVVGRILRSSIESRHIACYGFIDSIVSVSGIQQALRDVISRILNIYRKKEYYNITLIFTYISEKRAEISVEQVLPPDINRVSTLKPAKIRPLTYLEPEIIFNGVLEEFLYISLYRGFVESLRSENWYRMRSMEAASESLKRRITELGSLQKYVRQEEITEEMLEILGSGLFFKR
jgi:F-type H+-transporting ATPase subunit gamma